MQNLILVALAFVVCWGTFFPLISEAVTGTRASVGPPWFDKYTVPLAFALVALSGIGPLVPWRRLTLASVRRGFVLPGPPRSRRCWRCCSCPARGRSRRRPRSPASSRSCSRA